MCNSIHCCRAQMTVLKKGLLDEQEKSTQLSDQVLLIIGKFNS